ncbi:hypothetical protein OG709_31610 [Streptomyces sp. NBC_01267]|uniref:hypothetical protein n=1 Tax=Streptomyces sp. NBC_01267 TaxID=2903805 RepID=UPI002E2F1374|nr:hypothetical protein [Streptomyces sp. NBC_01267]
MSAWSPRQPAPLRSDPILRLLETGGEGLRLAASLRTSATAGLDSTEQVRPG